MYHFHTGLSIIIPTFHDPIISNIFIFLNTYNCTSSRYSQCTYGIMSIATGALAQAVIMRMPPMEPIGDMV